MTDKEMAEEYVNALERANSAMVKELTRSEERRVG